MLEDQIDILSDSDLIDMSIATESLEDGDIIDFLLPKLRSDTTYRIILDGLGEGDDKAIDVVACGIAKLCYLRSRNLKILCIGRPVLESRLLRWMAFDHKIAISNFKVMEDVERYLLISLNQYLEDGTLRLNDPTLILQISENLKTESEEIFLWTKLFIEEMCAQNTDSQILEALKNPPKKISELIDQKATRLLSHAAAAHAVKLLQYCGVLKFPLRLDQYRQLLTIKIGQGALDRRSLSNDMTEPVAACYGLVFVDEEDQTLHFAHHSIWKHVLTSTTINAGTISEVQLDVHLGSLCLTYLNFADFQRQLKRQKESFTIPIRPVQFGVTSVVESNGFAAQIAQKLLRNQSHFKGLSGLEMERKTQEILGESVSARLEAELRSNQYSFLEYARTQWIHHFARLETKLDPGLWKIFHWCIQDTNLLAVEPWQKGLRSGTSESNEGREMRNVFLWSVDHGNTGLLLYLVLSHWSDLTQAEKKEILSKKTFPHASEEILRHVFTKTAFEAEAQLQLFLDAVTNGYVILLELCLKAGIYVDSRLDNVATPPALEPTALSIAARFGHVSIVDKLLSAGADVNAASSNDHSTALHIATERGYLIVVEKRLEAGADVDAITQRGRMSGLTTLTGSLTALLIAATRGDLDVLEALLLAQADIHFCGPTNHRTTALHLAARQGHIHIVTKLISLGAARGGPHTDPPRALRLAAGSGHLHVVEYLLSVGFNPGAVNSEEWNAMSAAVHGGHLAVVKKLLSAGANPSHSFTGAGKYEPLIEMAAQQKYSDIAHLLAQSGTKLYHWPDMMTGHSIGPPDD